MHQNLSPSMGKYMQRSEIPYWSPGHHQGGPAPGRGGGGGGGGDGIETMASRHGMSHLATSAAEFVPGRSAVSAGAGRGGGAGMHSFNGMNSSAAEWVPPAMHSPSQRGGPTGRADLPPHHPMHHPSQQQQPHPHQVPPGAEHYEGEMGMDMGPAAPAPAEGIVEPMVEVSWNGSTFFVPESMAYAYEGGMEFPPVPEDDVGLEWAHGSLSLPAPPRRTIQTIGIPEPIRQVRAVTFDSAASSCALTPFFFLLPPLSLASTFNRWTWSRCDKWPPTTTDTR